MKTYILLLILWILKLNNSFPLESSVDSSFKRIVREVDPNKDQTTITTVKTVVTENKPISTTTQPFDGQQRFVRHQNDDKSNGGVNSVRSEIDGKPDGKETDIEPETSDQNIHEIRIDPKSEEKVSTDGSKTQETVGTPVVIIDNMDTSSTSISSSDNSKDETSLLRKIVDYLKLKLTEIYLYLISLVTDEPNDENDSISDDPMTTNTSITDENTNVS